MTTVVPNTVLEPQFVERIARDVRCRPEQVVAASNLFAEGATVPFVARYRKEATGGLSDATLETIARGREYYLELTLRRDAILAILAKHGKLTPELESAIRGAATKQVLEDLYLPYKPKRKTRAAQAIERGLEPLATLLLEKAADPAANPEELAAPFADPLKGVGDVSAALSGARDVLAERFAETPANRARLREVMFREAVLHTQIADGKQADGTVYRDYYDHREPAARVPSHRYLAILRGEHAKLLDVSIEIDDEREVARLAASAQVPLTTPCGREIAEAASDGYKRLLRPAIGNELRAELERAAEAEAIRVFRSNLEALLLQPPFGNRPVLGLDPGQRTGCKLAVVDSTGRVLDHDVIRPLPPNADEPTAAATVTALVRKHRVRAIAVGNGTGGRETELFARKAIREGDLGDEAPLVIIVPETGASVYSASAVAREELKGLDVTVRGAVSIARRLQDPLAELVKIEPRSLGVGQYQHDVNQKALARELDAAVESVVNAVGVELNSASPALLCRVSGLNEKVARSVVARRDTAGAFASREELLAVPGIGVKTFELAAGFLRIRDAANPLDSTAVHPERYGVVETMAGELGVTVPELVGNPSLVARLDLSRFHDESTALGELTLRDIAAELERPGRDPRPEFKAPTWREDVQSLEDLKVGMELEGRVSNVTNFGAFVDVGIKRDGLVHLSELSHRRITDPRERVKVGDVVRVKVIEVDAERGRASFSIKALEPPPAAAPRPPRESRQGREPRESRESRPRPARPGTDGRKPSRPEQRWPAERRDDRPPKHASSPPPAKQPPRPDRAAKKADPAKETHYTVEDLLKRFKSS
ncbi:MAG: Tex family protein [bacterium]